MADDIESKTLFTIRSHSSDFISDHHHEKYFVSEQQVYLSDWGTASTPPHDEEAPPPGEGSGRDITPAPEIAPSSLLRITTDATPNNCQMFKFGSSEECDFRLVRDTHLPISRFQFSIFVQVVSGTLVFIFINDSRNGSYISSHSLALTQLKSQRALTEGEELTVHFKPFDLHLRIPHHSHHWELFRKNFSKYSDSLSKDVPLGCLRIDSDACTRNNLTSSGIIYDLIDRIGAGAFGSVHRAINRLTGQIVAAKRYHKFEQARTQEAMLLRAVTHDNIVKFHAFLAIEGQDPTLLMELINGNDLLEEHKSSPLLRHEVVATTKQLLDGLACLHNRNIVHRDVKPTNVMVVTRNPIHVKLVDFGLASPTDMAESFCGTPVYAAPEIMQKRPFNEKVDVWSLGISALELLYGLPNRSKKAVLSPLWSERVLGYLEAKPQCPMTRILATMLTINPKHRPSAEECLHHDLFSGQQTGQDSECGVELHSDEESTRPFTPDARSRHSFLPACAPAAPSGQLPDTAKECKILSGTAREFVPQPPSARQLPSHDLSTGSSGRQKKKMRVSADNLGEPGREPSCAASTSGHRRMTIPESSGEDLQPDATERGQTREKSKRTSEG